MSSFNSGGSDSAFKKNTTLATIPTIINQIYSNRSLRKHSEVVERTIGNQNIQTSEYKPNFKEKKVNKDTGETYFKNSSTEINECFEALSNYNLDPSAANAIAFYMELADVFFQINILLEYRTTKPNNQAGFENEAGTKVDFENSLVQIQNAYNQILNLSQVHGIKVSDISKIAEIKYKVRSVNGKDDSIEKLAVARYLYTSGEITARELSEFYSQSR
ncbi:MAG: hypothetical protein AAGF07_01155 [Patescibacteria group bacterium]